MMVARQHALDTRDASSRVSFPIGAVDALHAALPLTVEIDGTPIRIVKLGGSLHAYPARCPHMMAPLDHVEPDTDGCITCPWHGYRFNIETGVSADGRGLKLGPMPRICIDEENQATLVWP